MKAKYGMLSKSLGRSIVMCGAVKCRDVENSRWVDDHLELIITTHTSDSLNAPM